jgi:hypothetical protein
MREIDLAARLMGTRPVLSSRRGEKRERERRP